MRVLGDEIVSLIVGGGSSVLIVAPFMRSGALRRLLDCIPVGVETVVVTRWRIEDLLAGASDLGVYELAEVKGVPVFLRPDLHAKFFAVDDRCLVVSANVTDTALGWRKNTNLELLIPADRADEPVVEFEKQLFDGTVRATADNVIVLKFFLNGFRD